jgi:hypothetical protein
VFTGLQAIHRRVSAQPEVQSANVFESVGRVYGTQAVGVQHELRIQATLARPPGDPVPLSTRLAGIALQAWPDAARDDRIVVILAYGFDIGIASSWFANEMALAPDQWADRVAASGDL